MTRTVLVQCLLCVSTLAALQPTSDNDWMDMTFEADRRLEGSSYIEGSSYNEGSSYSGDAPAPATPVSATPVPATPVPATPVPATPVPATPVPATPVPAPTACEAATTRTAGCWTDVTAYTRVQNGFTCGATCKALVKTTRDACSGDMMMSNMSQVVFDVKNFVPGGFLYCGKPVKPTFNKDAYLAKAKTFTVAASWTPKAPAAKVATVDPVAPTDTADFAYKVVEVTKQALDVPIKFPITKEQAKDPTMQKSLTVGMAKSLGLKDEAVTITHVGGEAVRRRLAADLEITFQITIEEATTADLEKNIKEAAAEGSIVAAIQEEANTRGVLTKELLAMPIVIPPITVVVKTVMVKVVQQIDKSIVTTAPTKSPTMAKPPVFSGASSVSCSTVAALCAVLLSIACQWH